MPSYFIQKSESKVQLWSTVRLPFEPHGWSKVMRNELRSTLKEIHSQSDTTLQATYISPVIGRFDVENVLVYNLGSSYLRHLCTSGLSVERLHNTPPDCPIALDGDAKHYHHYEVVPPDQLSMQTHDTPAVVQWDGLQIPPLHSDTKPHNIWMLLREYPLVPAPQLIRGDFDLELTLSVPNGSRINAATVMKPIIDGVVSAFHSHDGSDLPLISERLSQLTDKSQSRVKALLMETDMDILGTTRLIYPYFQGIQWNPSDHLCRKAALIINYSDEQQWTLAGRMHECT